jgi:hypothetical protein
MFKMPSRVLLVLSVLMLSACKYGPLMDVEQAPLGAPDSATLEQVEQAIVRAGTGLDWKLKPKGPGVMSAKLIVNGKHIAVVAIAYDRRNFSITYSSSQNLNYRIWEGEPRIHPNYNIWVKQLKSAIEVEAHSI